jgi:hypothetical protein
LIRSYNLVRVVFEFVTIVRAERVALVVGGHQ